MPLMILELVTAIALVVKFNSVTYFWTNLMGVLLIWLGTFLISVPLHNILSKKIDSAIVKRLVFTNWHRTVLWTARLILLFYFLNNRLEARNVTF